MLLNTPHIGQRVNYISIDNLFKGKLRERVPLGVDADAGITGRYPPNPFTLQNFGVNYMTLFVN